MKLEQRVQSFVTQHGLLEPGAKVLVALSVLSSKDANCQKALEQLPKLNGCQVHSTVMLSEVDRKIFKKLGVGLTCDPNRKKSGLAVQNTLSL